MKPESERRTVAYVMSRFPKVSETFILSEIVELERLGLRVEVFPLLREEQDVRHPEAHALAERAHYTNVASRAVLSAQLFWLLRRPRAYVATWVRAILGNLRVPEFLLRTLYVVPKAAYFARRMHGLGATHVHAHYATHPALAAYVIRRLTGLPYSFTAHAHDIFVKRPMLAEKMKEASFVVTVSEHNRTLLRDLYGEPAEKVAVIHCGVDLTLFRPEAARRSARPFTLLCVASLEEYKGHLYLLAACRELRTKRLDFRCLLVGDGEDRSRIEAEIERHGLRDVVTLLGHQPRGRVSELMAEADVLVLPSITTKEGKKEGLPVVLMEALACELPVIATEISGVPELIEDGTTGLLVPERDAAALAAAVLLIHRNADLRRRLGAAGRDKVLRSFDVRRTTATLHALLVRDWSQPGADRSEPMQPPASPRA